MVIVEGASAENYPEAAYWIMRSRYRERFAGLTAAQTDAEPFDEVMTHMAIWDADARKQERERMRNAHSNGNRPQE